MPDVTVQTGAYPQSGLVPTRNDTLIHIASYSGGENSSVALERAGRCYDSAVRGFNSVRWKFNRLVNNITLVASTSTYDLQTDFADPYRAFLVNAAGEEVYPVTWMEWGVFEESVMPNIGTSTYPQVYSARNVHETGQVTVWPPMGTTLLYPTFRIYYFRRIAAASGNDDRLNVPEEVYEAILQESIARYLAKSKDSAAVARTEYDLARLSRQQVEQVHRDWPDWS